MSIFLLFQGFTNRMLGTGITVGDDVSASLLVPTLVVGAVKLSINDRRAPVGLSTDRYRSDHPGAVALSSGTATATS